jgi:hypothetical protein
VENGALECRATRSYEWVHNGETFAVPSEAPKLNLFLKIWS